MTSTDFMLTAREWARTIAKRGERGVQSWVDLIPGTVEGPRSTKERNDAAKKDAVCRQRWQADGV
jgi:hypothetical protein